MGETMAEIAGKECGIVGFSSLEWVETQIKEAGRLLEVKRRSGRPQKGGVLHHWKLMVR